MTKRILFTLLMVILSWSALAKKADDGSQIQSDNYYPRVKLSTSMGDIIVELDRRKAPITSNNFLRYVDKMSYDGTIFHRIVPGFVVQGGGYDEEFKSKPSFPAIFNESGNGLKNELHTIAMARMNDPHSATRQFYFNVNDNTNLDPGRNWGYTVFGTIVEGYEIVDAMAEVETHYSIGLNQPNVPVEPIVLQKAIILPPTM